MPHQTRAVLASRYPVHVTVRLKKGLPTMRARAAKGVLLGAFRKGKERFGFRLVHYAILSNHLHLIVEARDRRALSRGMQGLLIRVARGLNKLWGRAGKLFDDRYHDHILKSPREVRHALVYVLQNAKKHGLKIARTALDPFSSARFFPGWRDLVNDARDAVADHLAQARTWLLGVGWTKAGSLSIRDLPKPPPHEPRRR